MNRKISGIFLILLFGLFSPALVQSALKTELNEGWWIQSSAKVKESGAQISLPGAEHAGWYSATVPNTVLAILAAHNVYEDPYFGMNLARIPGNLPKPFDLSVWPRTPFSPFAVPWWYRTEFRVPPEMAHKNIQLHFDGVNYKANVWVNGRQVALAGDMAGIYRVFDFDISGLIKTDMPNALAVEVYPSSGQDLTINWVDWNPPPPDRNLGLWKHVYLTASGPVSLHAPFVKTELDVPALDKAHLTVIVDLRNETDQPVNAELQGQIRDIKFSKQASLEPRQTKTLTFTPQEFPQLNVSHPELWWPAQLGPQNLHQLTLECTVAGEVSDRQSLFFGIRQVTAELTPDEHLLFQINGQNILIRGAAWTPDMMLRYDPERMEREIRYVKEMNLNTLRLEGKMEFERFYEICDREGILVMPGWCCCDRWERWYKWQERDYQVAAASEHDQCRILRSHPSVFSWLYGSDFSPAAKAEQMYLDVLDQCAWPDPHVSSANDEATKITGQTGVKMTGPYEWVAPVYWYVDKKRGGAFGFNTETCPGPAVPPIESLRRMLPEDKLWPINRYWNYHAGRVNFGNIKVFTNALNKRYGKATSAEDFAVKSQAMTYEAQRAMFEAYSRNKYTATGVIQFMLNTAWPGLIWHLYDYYLRPGGGYFGTKIAGEPVHIQYGYDDNSVYLVNSLYRDFTGLKARVRIFNLDMTEKYAAEKILDLPADASVKALTIPALPDLSTTYFLKLELSDAGGEPLSSNFYWLSTRPDELAKGMLAGFVFGVDNYTPNRKFADFTDLQRLPKVELLARANFGTEKDEGLGKVIVENPTPHLAFMVRLKINSGRSGEEILPVYWSDNYFSLLPGEKKEVTVRWYLKDAEGEPSLEVGGWNILGSELKF